MINMCAYRTCPHHAEPCEFTDTYLTKHLEMTTVCPIGEDENIYEYDPDNTFFLSGCWHSYIYRLQITM